MSHPKNVIMIVTDSWQYNYTGCYGNDWIKTPNIDRLAREGIVFDNAFSEGLPTIPVRRTLATGRFCSPHFGWSNITNEETTLADYCYRNHAQSALIADTAPLHLAKYAYCRGFDFVRFFRGQETDPYYANDPIIHLDPDDFHKPIYEPGTADEIDISQLTFRELNHFLSYREYWKSDADQHSAQTCFAAMDYLENIVERTKPFFLWVDIFDPHEPWDPPSVYDPDLKCPYDPDYKGKELILPVPGPVEGRFSEEELHHIRMLYAEKITTTDKWVGALLDRVKTLGLYDNTMIIWLADHGEPLGHGEHGHGIMRKSRPWPYDELVHIPLVIRHPDIPSKRVASLVQNTDVAPTILEYMGIEDPEAEEVMQGQSLMPLMSGEKEKIRDFAIAGFHNLSWSIYTDDWSYIHWPLEGEYKDHEGALIRFYHDNLQGQYPDLEEFRPGVYDRGMKASEIEAIWSCTPGAETITPPMDELYDRKSDPQQLNNIIEDDPKTANDLYGQLRDFMIGLKAGTT
jgi:arylsulfatase A-like enzyme